MIDHVTVRVQDFSRLLEFYKAALAPLRYEVVMQFEGAAGLGADGKPDLWLMQTDQPLNPTHLALSGERDLIDAFHAAALDAGGTDNGGPGLRFDYHPHYYAAFVHDPEGNNIEVVSHADPEAARKLAEATRPTAPARARAKRATKPAAKKSTKPAKAKAKPKTKAKPTKKAKVRGGGAKPGKKARRR